MVPFSDMFRRPKPGTYWWRLRKWKPPLERWMDLLFFHVWCGWLLEHKLGLRDHLM